MIFYSLLTGNVVLNIILNLTRYQEDFFYHAGRKKKKKQENVKTAFSLNMYGLSSTNQNPNHHTGHGRH